MLLDSNRSLRFIKFLVAGGLGTFGYIFLSYLISSLGVKPWTASFIAYASMIPLVYSIQRIFVFKSRESKAKSFLRYLAIQLLGLFLSAVLPYLLSLLNVPALVSFVLVSMLAALVSYFLQLRWAFSNAK